MYKKGIKRLLDVIMSFLLTIISFPIILIILIFVKIGSKGPAIFKQKRIGKSGKVFNIYKIRTMCVGAETQGTGVYSGKNDVRVTKIGKILRATSLDELPQIWNILKGDMSFVGPRPPLTYHPWEYSKYTDEQKRMFEVRPGITGWAQVNGRKDVEWNQRIKLNVWYVDNVTMWLDIKILFITVFKVLANKDNENVKETVVKNETQEQKDVA